MQKLHILNAKEIKELHKKLLDQWGIEKKLEYVFLENEKNRIFITNRDFQRVETEKLNINSIGLYFGEIANESIRLSIEGSQIIGPLAKKNVVELNKNEAIEWLSGNDIQKESDANGFVIIKSNEDYLGTGKMKEGKIFNYVPKTRRINPDIMNENKEEENE